jgi:hypothetical protein
LSKNKAKIEMALFFLCIFLPVIVDPQGYLRLRLVGGERNNRRGLGRTPFYEGSIAAMNVGFLNFRKVIIWRSYLALSVFGSEAGYWQAIHGFQLKGYISFCNGLALAY